MFIAAHEWQQPPGVAAHAGRVPGFHGTLYAALANRLPDEASLESARDFLRDELGMAAGMPCGLPESPDDLHGWMTANAQAVHTQYAAYLAQRREGAGRRYFKNRAHALYFLRNVAPTKLVDGAWLYGLAAHAGNPRTAGLVRTYLEELGNGDADKNHVVLYRRLLQQYGIDPVEGLDDSLYRQGLIQLALGWSAGEFLPEVIGFNLGYEQLPLHLLITAYELNELGIDPYYFTLHVTVDNCDTGHARMACQAALDALPRLDDGGVFWRRMREGSKLADAGAGTTDVIAGFDIGAEVLRILANKAQAGHGAHSDYCRIGGRSVNDWLSSPETLPRFLATLQSAGWIKPGEPPSESRFWNLLQGPRAEMFGVFSDYELQVIHDWIRGDAAADGMPCATDGPAQPRRRPTFRAAQRGRPPEIQAEDPLDPDLSLLKDRYEVLDAAGRRDLLLEAMSPASHWTPAGLHATREFVGLQRG